MNKSSAIDFYGTQRAVAVALRVSDQAVSAWPEIIPKGAALELEKITNGALKCDLSVYKNRPRKNKRRSSPDTSPTGETQ
ncbi:helix-turn-helix domain-containing protein [Salmonella enterica]|nr:helix-turn-helix domain-containing protein [Salmonella enterica]